MELTKDDLKDAVRLGTLEAMAEHNKEEHTPLWAELNKVRNRMAMWSGAAIAVSALIGWAISASGH